MSEENRNALELIQMAFKHERRKWAPIFAILGFLMTGGATIGASYIKWHDSDRDKVAHEVKQDQDIVAIRADVDKLRGLPDKIDQLIERMNADAINQKEFRSDIRDFVRSRMK